MAGKSFALVVALAVAGVGCRENVCSHHESLADARRTAVTASWLPRVVPEEATRIQECHNIDSLATWGAFDFSDEKGLRSNLRALSQAEFKRLHLTPPSGAEFWPAELTGELVEADIRSRGIEAMVSTVDPPSYPVTVLVNWTARRCYFVRRRAFLD